MSRFERRIALHVLGVHTVWVLFLMLTPSLKGCFRPKPKPEILTLVEFLPLASKPAAHAIESTVVDGSPENLSAPKPAARVIESRPVSKTVPPQSKPEKKKSKWKAVDPKDIRLGKKVKQRETAPPNITEREITKALAELRRVGASAEAEGNSDAHAAYIARVGRHFDRFWRPPLVSAVSGAAAVRIHITKSGRIVKRIKIQSSGDPIYDKTVMDAVNSDSTVPKPPSDFPYKYVEVEFRLRNSFPEKGRSR